STDLSYRLPSPGNQGKASSCTAWAVAYAARGYYTAALENRDVHLRKNLVSPTYVYTLAKQLAEQAKPPQNRTQNHTGCQSGGNLFYAVEVLRKGALSLLEYPYHESDCDPPPGPQVVETATDFRVRGLQWVN